MELAWLTLVALMVVVYAVLESLDLGIGILHSFVGRNEAERERVARSIRPVWNGNEIWLLAAGAALYIGAPRESATIASGLYLPLIALFWLLILRGLTIDVCHRTSNTWLLRISGAGFGVVSALLALLLGWIGGSMLLRTLPAIEADGWYRAATALTALAAIVLVGALRIASCTGTRLSFHAARIAWICWPVVVLLTAILIAFTFAAQPRMVTLFSEQPGRCFFPALAIAGLTGVRAFETPMEKLISACAYVVGMLAGAAIGFVPSVATSVESAGQVWWIPGVLVMAWYFSFYCRHRVGASAALPERGTRSEAVADL
jgi:cytochrome bd ubiquinol oxidase subunit II